MRIAFFGFGSCEGCRYRLVNELYKLQVEGLEVVREPLLGLAGSVDELEFDVAVVEGSVASSEVEEVKRVRERAKFVIAFGSCALLGEISTLGYRRGLLVEEYARRGYTNMLPLPSVVKVDGYVKQCPANIDELVSILRDIALGRRPVRYERRLEYDRPADVVVEDEFLRLDSGKCVVCGRCVELCRVVGAHALTEAFRGYRVIVATPFQVPFLEAGCIRCGLCAAYCPVSAVTYRRDIGEAHKLAREGGCAVVERLALEAVALALGVKPGQLLSLLSEAGFSNVSVVEPESLVAEEGVVPFSSAEERWLKRKHPEAVQHAKPHVTVPAGADTVVVSMCAARKEDHAPTLTAHELLMLVRGMRYSPEDFPEKPLAAELSGAAGLKVAVGPEECERAIEEYVNNPWGTLVLQLCPRGCAAGSGAPFAILNKKK